MNLGEFGVEVKDDKPKAIDDTKLKLNFDKIKQDFSSKEVERYLPWFLKYQLNNYSDLIKTKEIKQIEEFLDLTPKGKGLLLIGRAGSGKTTTVSLFAKHLKYELFELNASDARNKASILEQAGNAIKQQSLFGSSKIILIDEVDGVSGTKDKGGVVELIKLLKLSSYPVVFTANDKESDKIKALKKHCKVIDFENHSFELLKAIALRIFEKETIDFKEEKLKKFIEERSTFDIRGFINDLQASVFEGSFCPQEQLELRDYKKKIELLLETIFYSYPEKAVSSMFNSDINLDDLMLYLEENIPSIYSRQARAKAFNELSKADVFRGKITKWQYWRYLVYVNFYLTYGVSASKDDKVSKMPFKRNARILKKWIYNNKVAGLNPRTKLQKKNDLPQTFIEKLAKNYGCSASSLRKRDLPYFIVTYKKDKEFQKEINERFELDEKTKNCLLEY